MSEERTNTIGKDFTLPALIKFVAAPVVSKLFIALLSTLDDSLFLSRYCSPNALAAFAIAMPWFMIVDAVGMLLCGVSVYCSILMGKKENEKAMSAFTTSIVITGVIGLFFTLILSLFREKILILLNATEILLPYAMTYMNVSRFYTPLVLMSYIFSRFYVIAGKPKVAVASTIIATICNFFFDWLFIVKLQTGIVGTAYANLISNIAVNALGFIFFSNKNEEIHFTAPKEKPLELLKEVFRLGRSQFLTSIALSIGSYVSNSVLLAYGNELSVSAFTIVNNVQFMSMNAFFGLSGATSPIVSYAYGEKNPKKLSRILTQVVQLFSGLAVILAVLFLLLRNQVVSLYLNTSTDSQLADMLRYGLKVVPFAIIVFGYNFMVQDLAISVGNDKVSTTLSLIENVVLANLTIILLPKYFGLDGVWYAFLLQEIITLFFSGYVVYVHRDVYGYGRKGIATFVQQ